MIRFLSIVAGIGSILVGLLITAMYVYKLSSGDFMIPTGLWKVSYFITMLVFCVTPVLLGVTLLNHAFRSKRKQGESIQP